MTTEKPTVEDFFRSVPIEVTDLPIFQDEDGIWFAYGHVDAVIMDAAINAADTYNQGEPSKIVVNPKELQYLYAKISNIKNSDPDWEDEVTFTTCKPTEEGAFPVTALYY